MAERATIARPYARAAFSAARQASALPVWSQALQAAAAFAGDERVEQLISSPKVGEDQLVELLADAGGKSGDEVRNFIRLLAKNRRLALLPEIAAQFEVLRAEVENTAAVEVTSAVPLSAEQQAKLAAALKTRLKRDIQISTAVDPTLLGGAVIRCGDLVIDGSIKGRLAQLQTELSN
ncbi:MAG: F0F1 ATP synthase subunit delta [Proteobacteria bacterium]|nr:F0F1 ATP synthase subunit delta [Pseudomonadota bacterium]